MHLNKYSRRKFIGISSVLAGVPGTVLALIRQSADGKASAGKLKVNFQSVENVPDLQRIALLLKQDKPLKWLFTGDSITAGVEHTHGYRSYSEIFEECIHWELKRSRDVVINTGISGNTTVDILEDFNWRIEQFKPETVSLMIGTNDCARKEMTTEIFEEKLNILLDKIRGIDAIPILHTPNVIIKKYASERTDLPEYVKAIQKTAEKKKIILVDNYAYWEDVIKNYSGINVFDEWLNDPLHPNGRGHKEIARLMFKELFIFNLNDATCGGKYYEGKH
ncbi:MAG TPA: SGNH/GDSL hydrolase family protein [Hanamia sp.]|nr:SGNH/GDSL hydrolase family protein [Hanamia sp.]